MDCPTEQAFIEHLPGGAMSPRTSTGDASGLVWFKSSYSSGEAVG
ncbi:hypothetical protein [Streptomyces sp. WAC 01420]|nr:hypothetical protein [Streptomyces sp. WAC 01420]